MLSGHRRAGAGCFGLQRSLSGADSLADHGGDHLELQPRHAGVHRHGFGHHAGADLREQRQCDRAEQRGDRRDDLQHVAHRLKRRTDLRGEGPVRQAAGSVRRYPPFLR
ncbi:hypothetical protein PUN4_330017 [Paraburkholderia unamae]|nr:hypothetical protein PUN4_330017 [Paraburkholderia unamae]